MGKLKAKKKHESICNGIAIAKENVVSIIRYQDLRCHVDITTQVGCDLENNINPKYNVNIRSQTIELLREIYNLTEDEIKIVAAQFDDRKLNKKIKRTSLFRKVLKLLLNFFVTINKK